MRRLLPCPLPLLLLVIAGVSGDFHEGEYVPTSRRSNFHSVSVPLPRPTGLKTADDYKVQLSFDGDRFLTPWLRLVGRRVRGVPGLEVLLTRTGSRLSTVRAQVIRLPTPYLAQHPQLVGEWANATHWPKHLLVEYSWHHRHSVDALGGLYLAFAAGLLTLAFIGVSTLGTYDKKLKEFIAELTAEQEEQAAQQQQQQQQQQQPQGLAFGKVAAD